MTCRIRWRSPTVVIVGIRIATTPQTSSTTTPSSLWRRLSQPLAAILWRLLLSLLRFLRILKELLYYLSLQIWSLEWDLWHTFTIFTNWNFFFKRQCNRDYLMWKQFLYLQFKICLFYTITEKIFHYNTEDKCIYSLFNIVYLWISTSPQHEQSNEILNC